ncbi:TonB-dependent receptor [Glaciecola sp. MH2013]|uniref:TonB-dependent receptor domain-containing protein n=1 Tax=Glaciecola sp. MH2013 TaxID=2785524 RepID=UPI00189E91F2|nr:TonB-dependent receptor [Glaciecola sp. MH2013]MBF7071790.1 TonB-dependent receptor [Glaciecola sp. MH2013]
MQKSRIAKTVERILFGTMLSSAALIGVAANAQEALDDGEDVIVTKVERIKVTGSRIGRTEVSEAAPIFTFDSDELNVRGFTNVADLLTQSPLFGGNQTPLGGQNGFTAGQNSVNLFDLGTQRTLTLVNGRRLVTGTSAALGGSEVDLNTIPAALVERIEIVPLTGAAIYGADAIAGTVNVILKDDYEGFEVTAQYGNNDNSNAQSFQISTLGGGNFANGRGNIVFGVEYTDDEGLLDCDQDFLCNGSNDLDNARGRFVDLDGDGQPDDINGDGVVDSSDTTSLQFSHPDLQLQLFTEYGGVTPGGGFLPDRGLGSFADGNFYQFTRDGDLTTCQPGEPVVRSLLTQGADTCSNDFFDSVNQIRSPVSRFNTFAAFSFDITDDITFKQDLLYANTEGSELVNQGGFQTGFFGGTSAAIDININNPLLSEQARNTLLTAGLPGDTFSIHRFNNDLVGLGANSNETQTWRVSNILEGTFELADRDWFWDAAVIVGRSDIEVRTTGIVDGRFLNAVDARRVDDDLLEQIRIQDPDDATDDLADLDAALAQLQGSNSAFTGGFGRGDIICGAYADLAAGTLTGFNDRATGSGLVDEDLPFLDGCVPLSLFGENASTEALEFITGGQQISSSSNKQVVYTFNIGSTIVDLPGGPLDFVVGYEARIEDQSFTPGVGQRVPITRSSISQPISGGFDTSEFYAEINAPIVSADMDIPLVKDLELTAAFRSQEFNTDAPRGFSDRSTDKDVYSLSLRWSIVDDVALRSTFATGFRNPSINELFLPLSQTFISGDDPCDARSVSLGPNPTVRRANCESIGIDTSTFTSSIQDGTISGGRVLGNPDLIPEESEALSVGLIITPTAIDNLSITIDYYDLEINDAINQVSFEDLASTCFDSNDFPNEAACSTFTRDENFQITSATNRSENVAVSTFESVAFNVFYKFDVNEAVNLFGGNNDSYLGELSIRSQAQHNITNEFQATPSSEVEEDVGDFADPDWIGTFDTNYTYNDLRINWRMRWQSSVLIDSLEQTLYAPASATETFTGSLDNGDEVEVYRATALTNETDARFIHDLSIGYVVAENTLIQANFLNVLNRRPDQAGRIADAVGHFGVDEELGRRFSIRINHKF